MFGNRFSSSTNCLGWLHETAPGRPEPSLSCHFLKVATHPSVVVPARAAYSRSASVGSRYRLPPDLALSFPMNAWTSWQETCSTGQRLHPENCDGLPPITACHWSWVTSYLPR